MNMKRFFVLSITAAAVLFVLGSCIIELEPPTPAPPWGDTSETIRGTGRGFKSDIVLNVTFVNGMIRGIVANHDDTPSFADPFIRSAIPLAIAANSFEASIFDGLAGATATRNGFIAAGNQATAQATGEWVPSNPFAPSEHENASGFGTGRGAGFYGDDSVVVSIFMFGGVIREITASGDTDTYGGVLYPMLIPRAIAGNGFREEWFVELNNTLQLESDEGDALAGATASMHGFIEAGNAAIQAIGGGN